MALLRECLQELRVKQRVWHDLPGGWPASKPVCGPTRFHRIAAMPMRAPTSAAPFRLTA